MNIQQAKELIKKTFESSFDKENFTKFIKNLLNNVEENTFKYEGNYIPEAFKPHVKSLERIGKYNDDNDNSLDILVVTLQKKHLSGSCPYHAA